MTQTARTVLKNTIWLSAVEIVNTVLLFFLTVWITRYLGASQYGLLAFALSLTTLFSIFIDFGLGTLMIREIARDRSVANKFLSNVLSLRIGLGFLILIILFSIVFLSGQDRSIIQLVVLIGLSTFLGVIIQSFTAVFRGYEKMEFEAIGMLISTFVTIAAGVLFILNKLPIIYFGWMYLLGNFSSMLFAIWAVRVKFIHFTLRYDLVFWKYLIRESWPFALSLFFISIYYYMDSVMLGFMKQSVQVGWYNADYKILLFVLIFAGIIGGVLFPLISRRYKESLDKLKQLLADYLKLMITLAIPLAVGGMVLANSLINFFYGSEFMGGVLAFQILIWTAAIIYISTVFGGSLQACDRQRIYVLGVGIGAAVNVVLNFILIPPFSLNGAAAATLIAELAVLVFMYLKIQKIIKLPLWQFIYKPIIAALVMGLVLFSIKEISALLLVIIGVIIYGIVLFAIKGITIGEIRFFYRLFKSKI